MRNMNPMAESLRRLGAAHSTGALQTADFLHQVCALVSDSLRCNRVSLWRFEGEGDERLLRCLALHDVQAAAPLVGAQLKAAEYASYFEALTQSGVFQSEHAHEDPRLAAMRDSYLRPLDIRALLDVAFSVNGVTFGILCCEQVGAERHWQPHDVAQIRRAGSVLSLALASEHLATHDG